MQRAALIHLEANSSGRRGSSSPSAITVDPTCSFVAVGDCSGGVRVWDVSQTSGTALLQCPQDSSGRLPASISLISWFKAHARRVSFIAFTSSSDIITVSSGAAVRIWSVTGAVIGKVGKAFQSVNLGSGEGVRFRMGEGLEPEVSNREAAEDDDVGDDAVAGSGVNVEGTTNRRDGDHGMSCDDDDDEGEDADENEGDDGIAREGVERSPASALGQKAAQAIKLHGQRHGKAAHRRVPLVLLTSVIQPVTR